MTIELIALGITVGTLSGFFGIGGGTVTIPLLMTLGFGIKEAIALSVMQMLFGSLMAALMHYKKKTYDISNIKYFGFGGFIGAIFGAVLVKVLDASVLEWFFLAIVAFTLGRFVMSSPVPMRSEVINRPLYVVIGSFIGLFSGMLGVGGSILMTPILVTFMGFELKKASAIGLFFVIFTSTSAFVTLGFLGMLNWQEGLLMAFSSLIGIWIGIYLLERIHIKHYKQVLIAFYSVIFALSAYKIIVG